MSIFVSASNSSGTMAKYCVLECYALTNNWSMATPQMLKPYVFLNKEKRWFNHTKKRQTLISRLSENARLNGENYYLKLNAFRCQSGMFRSGTIIIRSRFRMIWSLLRLVISGWMFIPSFVKVLDEYAKQETIQVTVGCFNFTSEGIGSHSRAVLVSLRQW